MSPTRPRFCLGKDHVLLISFDNSLSNKYFCAPSLGILLITQLRLKKNMELAVQEYVLAYDNKMNLTCH